MAKVWVIICLIFISHYKVEGIHEEKENGATISITTANGEVYDCIDFYKQPAFNNPSLKNSTSKVLESNSLLAREHGKEAPQGVGLQGVGCPFGTMPILRRTNQERENLRGLQYSYMPFQGTISPQGDPPEPDHCYAIVRTNDPNAKYLGADGELVLYNPRIQTPQWSAARMRLQNGPDFIETGWMVNQDLFKDDKTHLYIRFVASGKGCFNLDCPGFVHVGKEIPIGLVAEVSQRGVFKVGWRLTITKHKEDGNWWLSINDNYGIGYWPKSLFSSLAEVANQVEWGGEVYNPPWIKFPPEMGCGYKAAYSTKYSAFYNNATLVDENFQIVKPPRTTVKYQNCKETYNVLDFGDQGPYWGRIILYGGPGPSKR